jgi:hypothetical protein
MRAKRTTRFQPWATMEVRQLLRQFGPMSRNLPSVMATFRVDDQEAHRILNRLYLAGYVRRDPAWPEDLQWYRTAEGDALAQSDSGPPLARARVDRLLQGVLRRVAEINQKPHYVCRVVAVGVFGAYLTDAPLLDVLDLVVRIAPKPPTPGTTDAVFRPDRALPYWRLQKLLPRDEWPRWRERHVELCLAGGKQNLVLHSFDDPLLRGQRVRVVYVEHPETPLVGCDSTSTD